MSGAFVGLMLGAGVAAWVYNQVHRRTGGNSKHAAIVAGIVGVLGFALTWYLYALFAS